MVPGNYYKRVQKEIDDQNLEEGLWLKCYAEARGNDKKAHSIYLARRAEQLFEEELKPHQRWLRSLWETIKQLNRARAIALGSVALILIVFFSFQPFLHAAGQRRCREMWAAIQGGDMLGKKEKVLFQSIGFPRGSEATDTSRIYIYNPSSRFCMGRSRYELRVFIGNGTVTGFQEPMAVQVP